jgi:hypothetical protein
MAEISSLLRGALLALFVGLILSAVQIAGKTNVPLARLLLAVSWVVGVIGVWGNAPAPNKTTITIAAGVLFGVGLTLLGWWFGASQRSNLKAEIICLTSDAHWKVENNKWDCFLTMSVNVKNEGADTTILDFDCEVSYGDSILPSQRIYNLSRYEQFCGYEPSDDPSSRESKEVWERLYDFPNDAVVSKSKNSRGWLRFHVTSLPNGAMRTETSLNKRTLIKLYAIDGIDRDRKPHLIYEGPEPDGACGKIRNIDKSN